MTLELIDKIDNFEFVGDQIAAILATEIANQQAEAVTAGKDPNLWRVRIFQNRAQAWEVFLNPNQEPDLSPIANVWFDTAAYDQDGSDVVQRQKTRGVYNIDIYGYGKAKNNVAGGHLPGDREAAENAHRAARLIRNILMAAENTYLQARGIVWQRWPQSLTSYQPELDGRQLQNVLAIRLSLAVIFNEFSPQVAGESLELVSIDVLRAETGEVLAEMDYDYTT